MKRDLRFSGFIFASRGINGLLGGSTSQLGLFSHGVSRRDDYEIFWIFCFVVSRQLGHGL